jgi:predicted nucleotidyltransferase
MSDVTEEGGTTHMKSRQERRREVLSDHGSCLEGGQSVRPQVTIDRERLAAFCRRHHIRKLGLFGSVLREDFRADSDVDVLVEFDPDYAVGFRIVDIEEELSQILGGHRVDLVAEKYLNPRLRKRVLADAEVQYAEG